MRVSTHVLRTNLDLCRSFVLFACVESLREKIRQPGLSLDEFVYCCRSIAVQRRLLSDGYSAPFHEES